MRIHALAVDYDGTIAHHGGVSAETRAALAAVRESGRRLILVTGRELDDLLALDPEEGLTWFDAVVAENGALLFDPTTQQITTLGEPPTDAFLDALTQRGVPFSKGHVIVATWEPHETTVLGVIRDLGIERQVIFNKGAVMVLPSGVTKATGLRAALDRLGLSPHNTAAIGDAENDHNFLSIVEVAVAVGNALPTIKERADLVMRRKNGRGVTSFIQEYLLNDMEAAPRVFDRYSVELGTRRSGEMLRMPVHGANTLIVGASGSGKSTLTGVFVEQLIDQGYQVCVIDPEGDHLALDPLVVLGSINAAPTVEEINAALERTSAGIVINLVALGAADKVRFSSELIGAILAFRATHGRPHWLFLDEAHHLLPVDGSPGTFVMPPHIDGICMITLEPGLLTPSSLTPVTHLAVVGQGAADQVAAFVKARGLTGPAAKASELKLLDGEALIVPVDGDKFGRASRFRVSPRRTEHRRHLRKYAGGDLNDRSFYFRGPEGRLNLRAFNVTAFLEMARGVDEATWQHHFENGEIATWFRNNVKDPELAKTIDEIATETSGGSPDESRSKVLQLVQARYTN